MERVLLHVLSPLACGLLGWLAARLGFRRAAGNLSSRLVREKVLAIHPLVAKVLGEAGAARMAASLSERLVRLAGGRLELAGACLGLGVGLFQSLLFYLLLP
jgi:hypothetical protein